MTQSAPFPAVLEPAVSAPGAAVDAPIPVSGAAIPGGEPFTFDGGGAVTPNIRTVRGERAATNTAKTGINNFGSDTSGTQPGATEDFTTILGGDQCSAQGPYAVVGGLLSQANGDRSIVVGYRCIGSATICVCLGSTCSVAPSSSAAVAIGEGIVIGAGSPNSVGLGFNLAIGPNAISAVVLGEGLSATASFTTVLGLNAAGDREGELAHGSGVLASQGLHALDMGIALSGAPGAMQIQGGGPLTLDAYGVASMQLRLTATSRLKPSLAGHAKVASEVRNCLFDVGNPGIAKISELVTANLQSFASQGWNVTITAVAPFEVRITCDPGVDDVKFFARVEWSSLIDATAPFVPTNIAGLTLWLDAALGITLNAGNVSRWLDQSGVGDPNRNVIQATAGRQPLYVAAHAPLNGMPAIFFDLTRNDQLLSGAWAPAVAQPRTEFLVAYTNGTPFNRYAIDNNSDPTQAFFLRSSAGLVVQVGNATPIAMVHDGLAPFVACAEFNGATSKGYFSSLTADVTGNAGAGTRTGASIGSYVAGGGGFTWDGWIAEYIVYDRVLTATERRQVTVYLGEKYGIPITP